MHKCTHYFSNKMTMRHQRTLNRLYNVSYGVKESWLCEFENILSNSAMWKIPSMYQICSIFEKAVCSWWHSYRNFIYIFLVCIVKSQCKNLIELNQRPHYSIFWQYTGYFWIYNSIFGFMKNKDINKWTASQCPF